MRYFIDTNILIFITYDEDELDGGVREILNDCGNTIVISSESLREIAMLIRSGRDEFVKWRNFSDVMDSLDFYNIEVRYVAKAHMKTFYELTPARDHSDPADLMIIAQAITENIPLISSDTKFPLYTPQGLRFIQNNRRASAVRKKRDN